MQNNVFWGEVLHKIIQTVHHCCGTFSEMMPGAVTPLTNSVFASAVDLACMVSKKIDCYSQRINMRISNHTKIEIIFSKSCIIGIFTIFLFPVFEDISRLFIKSSCFFFLHRVLVCSSVVTSHTSIPENTFSVVLDTSS